MKLTEDYIDEQLIALGFGRERMADDTVVEVKYCLEKGGAGLRIVRHYEADQNVFVRSLSEMEFESTDRGARLHRLADLETLARIVKSLSTIGLVTCVFSQIRGESFHHHKVNRF